MALQGFKIICKWVDVQMLKVPRIWDANVELIDNRI